MNKPSFQQAIPIQHNGSFTDKIMSYMLGETTEYPTYIYPDAKDKNKSLKIIYLGDSDLKSEDNPYIYGAYHDPEGTKPMSALELEDAFIKGCVCSMMYMLYSPSMYRGSLSDDTPATLFIPANVISIKTDCMYDGTEETKVQFINQMNTYSIDPVKYYGVQCVMMVVSSTNQ